MVAATLGEVEHDAARRTLDLIRGLRAEVPELHDDRAQGSNQIQGHLVSNQHVDSPWQGSSLKGNASRRRPPRRGDARRDRPAQRPVTNALAEARRLPDAVLRGGCERRPSALAFGTRACADGRRAAPPRGEEAPRASCVRQTSHRGACAARVPREPEAENRKPRTGSREPKAEGRKPPAEGRQPPAAGRKPPAEGRGPRAASREPQAASRQPKAASRRPPAEGRQPKAASRGPPAASRRPRAASREPRAGAGRRGRPPRPLAKASRARPRPRCARWRTPRRSRACCRPHPRAGSAPRCHRGSPSRTRRPRSCTGRRPRR